MSMILVDTSVWIANLRDQRTEAVRKLRDPANLHRLLLADLVLLEVLQGARDEMHADALSRRLCVFPMVRVLDPETATMAARHFRRLGALGVTIRKTADLIIGTHCIAQGHTLLHDDRDFDVMQRHLGLVAA